MRIVLLLVTLTVTLVAVPACAAPAAAPGESAGPVAHTVVVDGRSRRYLLYRPASLPPGPVPLVVMLHGGGGSADAAAASYGWDALADRAGFAVAYPQGVGRSWSVGGGCCAPASRDGTDDVAFVTRVVSDVSGTVPVDPARVYATGISEGGMMAYRLACSSSLFAAVGADSATLLGDRPSPSPISVLHVHGTADTRIPYGGGPGAGVNHIDGPAVPVLAGWWRAVDRCAAPSSTRSGVVTTTAASCPDGRAVTLVTIDGAGHQWPGRSCDAKCARGRADPPSTALDATALFWDFFAAHPR